MGELPKYRAPGVVVSFDPKRCIHAGECVRGLPEVFDPKAKPWVRPERASIANLVETVSRCPTGALSLTDEAGQRLTPVPVRNRIEVSADGPLLVSGDLHLCDAEGTLIARQARVALCRCGASANPPYCDNSHRGCNFKDDGAFAAGELEDVASGGPLKLTLRSNGPVQCDGAVEVADAFGEVAFRGEQCWLCRCGASQNKPYCDGSHKKLTAQA